MWEEERNKFLLGLMVLVEVKRIKVLGLLSLSFRKNYGKN